MAAIINEIDVPDMAIIIKAISNSNPRLEPYRSHGFMNKDYDRARITIDLPIIEAKKLLTKIQEYQSRG